MEKRIKKRITEHEVWEIISKKLDDPIQEARDEILERDRTYPEIFIYERMKRKLGKVLGIKVV